MEDDPVWMLKKLVSILGYDHIAEKLGISPRTVRRWESGESGISRCELMVLEQMAFQFQPKKQRDYDFTFIDLFAGIGGFRIAFEKHGGKCIFTSEWDDYCQKTYKANFDVDHELAGALTDREWTCCCGVTHDRDHNAAINILLAGASASGLGDVRRVLAPAVAA